MPLLYALRNDLGLHGPRFGCGLGQCGACTVHLDGNAVRSCITPLSAVGDRSIVTLEGLGTPEKPHPMQQAFIDEQAVQCDWTDAQLQQFLSSGHAEERGLAAGPMAEVVENSLRYLTSEDIKAMVAYLRSIPAQPAAAATSARRVAASDAVRGRRLFVQACAGCHLLNGEGRQSPWAALRGDHSARDAAGTNVLQVLAHGTQLETNQGLMFMHPYIAGYSDDELAAIGNFVIDQFGLRQGTITPEQVRAQRAVSTNASESTILTR
jgi:cytochrome c553